MQKTLISRISGGGGKLDSSQHKGLSHVLKGVDD